MDYIALLPFGLWAPDVVQCKSLVITATRLLSDPNPPLTNLSALLHKCREESLVRAAIGVSDEEVHVTTGWLASAVGATDDHLQPRTDREGHLLHLGKWMVYISELVYLCQLLCLSSLQ